MGARLAHRGEDRLERVSADARIGPRVPLKRAATADEIAEATLLLLSVASSYTTGVILKVAGGR